MHANRLAKSCRRPAVCSALLIALLAGAAAAHEAIPVEGRTYGDAAARAAFPWAPDVIVYQVWLNSYGPQNALRNAEQHLDDIAQLGATMVQLSPVHPHALLAGPYSVDDYYGIEPAYGTEQDLRSYIDHAHRLGLKVIMDVVFVHTSPQNPLMNRPELYVRDRDGKVQMTKWGMPHLDPENPDTRKYLIQNLLYWVNNFHADGFRADVASGMGRTFWDEARDALDRAHPGAFLLAESTSPELMLHAFDATYGVSHMWTLFKTLEFGAPASQLRANWESDRAKFPRGTLFLRAVDNHDQRRAVTEFGNRAALAAMVVNFTLDGIPFIYNGQEIGDPNPTPVHFAYPIWWKQERTATLRVEGFTLYRGGYIGQDLDIYKKLIALRRREVALRRGDVQWVGNSDEDRIVSYMRVAGDQQFLIIVNMTNRPWKGTVAPGAGLSGFRAAITDLAEPTLVSNGRTFSLGPYGYFVGQREPAKG